MGICIEIIYSYDVAIRTESTRNAPFHSWPYIFFACRHPWSRGDNEARGESSSVEVLINDARWFRWIQRRRWESFSRHVFLSFLLTWMIRVSYGSMRECFVAPFSWGGFFNQIIRVCLRWKKRHDRSFCWWCWKDPKLTLCMSGTRNRWMYLISIF